ncbi:MAG: hypothetical protein J7L16_06505, partial [Deltaproteobacteria bacterium]|nr:hypothetical protein [Deltaproteobacteria bacterium]
PLASRGDRPLKMTFEDQLNALIFFILKNMYQLAISSKCSKRMISLVKTLLLKMESAETVFLKPLIIEGSSN